MLKNLVKHRSRLAMSGLALLMLAGCATDPKQAIEIAKPKTLPATNLTNFSDSLRCMDELLLSFGRHNIVVTSAGIPDATGAVSAGTKDMLISAISRMSVKSGAFSFVDYDATQADVHDLQSLIGFTDDFVVPNYYIRGAVTQLDEGVLDESQAAAIGISDFQIGASRDQTVSVVSLDLNVGNLVTRQIIPSSSAHNSIAVGRKGYAGDLAGSISKLGLNFNVILNKGEGMHQAVRTLVELSAIEVLGKLAEVPYWRCLQIEQTNPAIVAEAKDWYNDMEDDERVSFVQQALASEGYYGGTVSGVFDATTKSAVARYQSEHSLLADGRITFPLYQSLIHEDLALGRQPRLVKASLEKPEVRPNPLKLFVRSLGGNAAAYPLGQNLEISASTNQDAYLYCYYQDADLNVARIFPNQFDADPYVIAGQAVSIPSATAGFDIVLDRPGANEQIACLASEVEVGLRLPPALKAADLVPLPVGSVDDVVAEYRKLGRQSVVEARLEITVAR
jgi:peptidoglycan hydrolase-like protein with peptidoglycan-binding domain/curli biogenesis system outer membrane secretion channel CsgG